MQDRDAQAAAGPAAAIEATLLLEAMGEGVNLADENGIIVYTNPAADRMFGYAAGELIGKHGSIYSAYPAEETDRRLRDVRAGLRAEGVWEGEWLNVRKDGTELITAVRVTPIRKGTATYWLTVQRDVTDARRAEAALAASEELLRLATEGAGIGVYDMDLSDETGVWSAQTFRLMGLEPTPDGRATSGAWRSRIHPADKARVKAEHDAAIESDASWRMTYRIVRGDNGRTRWVETYGRRQTGPHGARRSVGVVIDVTSRREAEESLRESETRFQALANLVPAFIWFAGPEGAVRYLNDRWYAYTGQTPETALPRGWTAAVHPEDARKAGRAWVRSILSGESFEVECRYRHHSGVFRWYIARAEPLRNEQGEVEAWFGSCFDIHDLKQAETHHRLLIHELNHRVKNTLAIVQAIARQTFRSAEAPAAAKAAFDGRLAALSAAHDVLTRQSWETASIRQAVDSSLGVIGRGGDRIVVDGPDLQVPPKTAIALAMVIHELATNALKYGSLSTPNGRVELAWSSEGGRLRLEWHELGGPPVEPPQRKGFGTRLIEQGLAAELGGVVQLRFEPNGVSCLVDAPLPRL